MRRYRVGLHGTFDLDLHTVVTDNVAIIVYHLLDKNNTASTFSFGPHLMNLTWAEGQRHLCFAFNWFVANSRHCKLHNCLRTLEFLSPLKTHWSQETRSCPFSSLRMCFRGTDPPSLQPSTFCKHAIIWEHSSVGLFKNSDWWSDFLEATGLRISHGL